MKFVKAGSRPKVVGKAWAGSVTDEYGVGICGMKF